MVSGEASRKLYHIVSLERIRDRTTAKEPVVRIRYRTTANEPVGEKNEVKQHGYADSEKNIEVTMRLQSSTHRRAGEKG